MTITKPTVEPVSPTVIERWMRCPSYGWLAQRYEPANAKSTPYMLLGIAIAKGIELELTMTGDGRESIESMIASGWPPDDLTWPVEQLIDTAVKGYNKAITNLSKTLASECVIAVEKDLDQYHTRPDVVSSHGSDLIVTDHKVKYKRDTKYSIKNEIESEVLWQLWDYAYRVSVAYNQPVTRLRTHFIYLTPSPISVLHEIPVKPEMIELWHQGAENEWRIWHDLHNKPLSELPMRTTNCHNRYGRCEFYEACWLAGKNESQFGMLYTPRGRVGGHSKEVNQSNG